jgi:AcrR family transcriptional regulator
VSPTPARTSHDAIVAAARAILEVDGLDAVTMVTVAARVGVRPPSLYKHVRDRAALVEALAAQAAEELRVAMVEAGAVVDAAPGADPVAERVTAIAAAYRGFARRSPRSASLLFADLGPATAPLVEVSASAVTPVMEAVGALAGPERALPAARVLTAFVHGFTSMELAGAFRLGGDVDEAFRLGVETLVRGLRDGRAPA